MYFLELWEVFFAIVELEEEAWVGGVLFVCTFAELFIEGVIFVFGAEFCIVVEFFNSDTSMRLFGVFFELFDSRL
jgi:hypothetical protein